MKLTKILILLSTVCAMGACRFEDEPIEFDHTSVYFVNQAYVRNLVVGEGLAFAPGVQFAGVLENNAERRVDWALDASLLGDGQVLLPEDYYTIGDSRTIVIPGGQMKGYAQLRIDSVKFVGDPRALTGEFVLPFRLTESSLSGIDRITPGKEMLVVSLSYYAKQHANYRYSGTTRKTRNDVTTSVAYSNNATLTGSFRLLRTVGPDMMRVESDKAPNCDPALGTTTFYVRVPVHGGGAVTISADPDCPVAVSPDGTSTYDETTRTFTLRYKYTNSDGEECRAEDVLVFRNRIRDMQANGIDYLNEWW